MASLLDSVLTWGTAPRAAYVAEGQKENDAQLRKRMNDVIANPKSSPLTKQRAEQEIAKVDAAHDYVYTGNTQLAVDAAAKGAKNYVEGIGSAGNTVVKSALGIVGLNTTVIWIFVGILIAAYVTFVYILPRAK